jgi:extracellular factor (EF) 3-hydroxypalmitic acid methyl ester biosynthesis protein
LKDGGRSIQRSSKEQYDYIYCAGLFDYLSDNICKQLMNIFYEMLAPGGLLLATNATDALNSSRPFRYSMEYLLDWHLIYRDKGQFADVAPDLASQENVAVIVEDTAANLFLEVRKPKNA